MLGKYQIEYNGYTPENFGAFLPDYPQISSAKRQYEAVAVPGMDGRLISTDDYYDNITVSCTISVIHKKLLYRMDELKRWLRGTGRLRLSDMQDRYLEVLAVDTEGLERKLRQYGTFTVEFICYPYQFMNTGDVEIDCNELRFNPFDRCKPVYRIIGNGTCTINVNGKTLTTTIGEELTIDSRRMIAYKQRDTEWLNTSVTGDYEDLWLASGKQEISVSDGFELKIKPYWGWIA